MFDVNVHGLIAVTKAFSPLIVASKGTIVNIGSIAGKAPFPWQGYYNATKAAVNILSDTLRIELKPFGVKVINVVTGGILTHFFDNIPTSKLPEDSIYASGREKVEWAMNGGLVEKDGTDVNDYARAVVKNALKKSPKAVHWTGSNTGVIWLAGTFLWHTFWVSYSLIPFLCHFLMSSRILHCQLRIKSQNLRHRRLRKHSSRSCSRETR